MSHSSAVVGGVNDLKIFRQEWLPETPKAVVVLVHGLGEHSSRYTHVAEAFNAAGIAILSMDLPGHGQTSGIRGHIANIDIVLDMLSVRLDEAKKRFPGLPRFLYGHSMGGNISLFYCFKRKPAIQGVIVTSPGLGTGEPVSPIKKTLGKLLYNLAPSLQMDNGLDRDNLSQDRTVIERYSNDPLVHPKVSTRLAIDLLDNGEWIVTHASEFPTNLPLLLMQGSSDHIVSAEKTRQFAAPLSNRITYRVWDGLFHELHNEPQQAEVIKAMLDWMDGLIHVTQHN